MELSLKLIAMCVIFTYVFAEEEHHLYSTTQTTETPVNLTDHKEDRSVRLRKNYVDCTEETRASPDSILKLRSGKWKQALKKRPVALKKWSLCLLVKSNMMSPDGVLKQDVVLEYIPEKDRAKVENIIDKCLYKKRHPAIEIAWHYITCFRSQIPKYSII